DTAGRHAGKGIREVITPGAGGAAAGFPGPWRAGSAGPTAGCDAQRPRRETDRTCHVGIPESIGTGSPRAAYRLPAGPPSPPGATLDALSTDGDPWRSRTIRL